jgi:hypothetical protein
MEIIVAEQWLKTCGFHELIGKPLNVIAVRDFGPRNKFYRVQININNFERTWEVWSQRGVSIVSGE